MTTITETVDSFAKNVDFRRILLTLHTIFVDFVLIWHFAWLKIPFGKGKDTVCATQMYRLEILRELRLFVNRFLQITIPHFHAVRLKCCTFALSEKRSEGAGVRQVRID